MLARELVVELRADNTEGVGCLGVECVEAREASLQAERGTVVGTLLHSVFWLSVLSCLSQEYCRPNPGLLLLDILAGNGSLVSPRLPLPWLSEHDGELLYSVSTD